MRLALIAKLSYAATICLTILSTSSLLFANSATKAERKAYEQLLESRTAAAELGDASDYLTKEARRYTIAGDKRHFDNYWREVNETRTRDSAVQRITELGAPPSELQIIEGAKTKSDTLIALERSSMDAVAEGDLRKAQAIMFGEDYEREKTEIMRSIEQFQNRVSERTQKSLDSSRETSVTLMSLAQMVISLGALTFLAILYAVVGRGIMDPIYSLRSALASGAQTGLVNEVPEQSRDDEIGEIARAIQKLQSSARASGQR